MGLQAKDIQKYLVYQKKINKIYILTNQRIKPYSKLYFIKKIDNLNPDIIVIANETYKHYSVCKFLGKKFNNKIILCEKPLFNKFLKFTPKKNKFFITYNFRFNKCLQYIKKKVNLDKVFYIEAESSSYLPNWRKGIDYKNYSAFAAKGGGVLLDMSHEIDYINWLFKSFKITKYIKIEFQN